jgi:hypothetical protein
MGVPFRRQGLEPRMEYDLFLAYIPVKINRFQGPEKTNTSPASEPDTK